MEKITLSKRLNRVAEFVRKDQPIADIGSDHAYLPIYLVQNNIVPSAIAGEVVEGPYQKAVEQVKLHNLEEQIATRFGNGLEVLKPDDEMGTIFICGMGGTLISNILAKGAERGKLPKSARLVLQPNNGEKNLRTFLQNNHYQIIHENILKENNKIYEIIVAEVAEEKVFYSEEEMLFGPFLLKEKNDIFKEKWTMEIDKYEKILRQVEQSKNEAKELEFKQIIQTIKRVIT